MMLNLAVEFQRLGASPTIVTAQWHADWPTRIVCRETPVVRLPSPKSPGWGTVRYMHALSRWLRRHRDEYDAVCVSRLRHDAFASITALNDDSIPVIVRNEGGGETGDCAWLEQVRFGRRMLRAIQSAAAIIAPTPEVVLEASRAGFASERIIAIPNGVELAETRSVKSRKNARLALGSANRDLAMHPDAPLAVCVGSLHASRRLLDTVRAFRQVVEANPNARLWFIGDGPQREALYHEIVDLGLHHNVMMPGCFDDVSDVLQAADVFLSPANQTSMSHVMLQAMSHGLPVIAADIPGNRQLVQHDANGWLIPSGSVAALTAAVTFLMQRPGLAARLGAAARHTIENRYTITQAAKSHLQLMESLVEGPRAARTVRRKHRVAST